MGDTERCAEVGGERIAVGEGIYQAAAIPVERYHADPCPRPSLSASLIHTICTSSMMHAKFAHPRLVAQPEREDSEAMDIGTLAHSITLQGEASIVDVIKAKDWRTKAAQEARDASRAAGRVPLLPKQYEAVMRMTGIAKDAKMFTGGSAEVTLIWEEDGLWCRARLDWLTADRKHIRDYKTTSVTASPDVISRTLFNNGWDTQAAWYLRGLKALTGIDADFIFAVQETQVPNAISKIALGPDAMTLAEKKVIWAMDRFRRALDTGDWPGYAAHVCHATLSPWQEEQWLRKETADAF